MTSRLFAICFHAIRPADLARFWSGLLGWEPAEGPGGDLAILPPDATGFRIRFLPSREPKSGRNRAHFDLTSASPEDQRRTVARALELGGKHIDVGQRPEEGHVVLADPEGNEFCVIEAGNEFLAGTGLIGALACDGTQEVGYFWSKALRWPLVWDQDQETAIQSPHGGTKITWGGPPVAPKQGVNRVYLELALPAGAEAEAEADRLVALGATRPRTGGGEDGRMLLLDPDGNEFSVLGPPHHPPRDR
ncbi:VOC family protein [Streptomyces hoynatensis]|uniref:VOC family protein n=1 Tax=Streptomyces hoynatensis TaxID=1141874 RepID=A0A3A9Z6N5_9ACTN|nr:VOC family protein [Streptomyces hoynatensis]RKN43965.1 VOC family protein [Streptomyces hoynatensis]